MKKTPVKKLKLNVQTLQQLSTSQLQTVVGGRGGQGQNLEAVRPGGGYSAKIC
jgi:hypothetical protein